MKCKFLKQDIVGGSLPHTSPRGKCILLELSSGWIVSALNSAKRTVQQITKDSFNLPVVDYIYD